MFKYLTLQLTQVSLYVKVQHMWTNLAIARCQATRSDVMATTYSVQKHSHYWKNCTEAVHTIAVGSLILFAHCSCSWPVRTLSFSYDSSLIASASEDLFIDIVSMLESLIHLLSPSLSLSSRLIFKQVKKSTKSLHKHQLSLLLGTQRDIC